MVVGPFGNQELTGGGVQRIIAIANRKGGVGKTVTAVNLAGALVEAGHSVLAIDLDPQASLTHALHLQRLPHTLSAALVEEDGRFEELIQPTGIQGLFAVAGEPNLKSIELGMGEMMGREFRLRRCLQKQLERRFDFVLIDCPPSLGFLTANGIIAADEVLIPVDLGSFSLEALADTLKGINVTRDINYALRVLGILINNVNARTSYDQQAEAHLREEFGELVFQTTIPNSTVVDAAIHERTPITLYEPRSLVAQRVRALVDEVLAREVRRVA